MREVERVRGIGLQILREVRALCVVRGCRDVLEVPRGRRVAEDELMRLGSLRQIAGAERGMARCDLLPSGVERVWV